MSKTPSRRLFDLIKSLSGPEKRYFKVTSSLGNDSKCIQLFDAIERQKVFDDTELQQIVYGEVSVKSRKFSELKAYLYQLLVKTLYQYDEQHTVDYEIKNMLMSVRSLYKRGRYVDCKYLLNKAKKIAYTYELFTVVLEVLEWEKDLAYAEADIDFLDKQIMTLFEEEEECLSRIANLKVLESLFYELYVIVRKNTTKSIEGRRRLAQLIEHSALRSASNCLSFGAKVLFFRIQSILQYQARDQAAFYESCKSLIALIKSKPVLLKQDQTHYISALSNFAVSCGYMGYYDEMRQVLKALKQLKPLTIDDHLKIHRQYYTNYFGLCIKTGSFKEGEGVLDAHLAEVDKLDKRLFERSSFYFQYFYIYFGVGDYPQALKYLNEWLNLPKTVEQQDLQHLAHLLNLVLHFEMNHDILLVSLLRTTYRNLRRKSRLNAFEQLLLGTLKETIQLHSSRGINEVFHKAVSTLDKLTLTDEEQAMLRFFDFKSWMLSKAQQQPFATVVQAKLIDA